MAVVSKSLEFINEKHSLIEIVVLADPDKVVVLAEGPDSRVEHIWTRVEAHNLMILLAEALDIPIEVKSNAAST